MYFVHLLLETNLYDSTVRSHQPSGLWSGESYRPKTRYIRQGEPGRAFIRSPRSGSGRKCGRIVSGDHHCATEVVSAPATSASDITQTENRASYWWRTRQRPCHTAITRYCSARVIWISRV